MCSAEAMYTLVICYPEKSTRIRVRSLAEFTKRWPPRSNFVRPADRMRKRRYLYESSTGKNRNRFESSTGGVPQEGWDQGGQDHAKWPELLAPLATALPVKLDFFTSHLVHIL